jgi:hypothetical protein
MTKGEVVPSESEAGILNSLTTSRVITPTGVGQKRPPTHQESLLRSCCPSAKNHMRERMYSYGAGRQFAAFTAIVRSSGPSRVPLKATQSTLPVVISKCPTSVASERIPVANNMLMNFHARLSHVFTGRQATCEGRGLCFGDGLDGRKLESITYSALVR